MKFTLSFNCDNAAFEDDLNGAIAKVLAHVSRTVADHNAGMSGLIRDRNGNRIGAWRVEGE